ncbi:MAG: DNA polymerase III subunit delta [Oscillospiraceae bacterium]|jgi:DNA polymerase-3 subunit delta|nr:DNA polymerase III subunit delta [Oscillospiraceae bacterium]
MPPEKKRDTLAILKDDLKSGNIGSLYIFHGEEKYLSEHYLGLMKTALISEDMQQFNLFSFDGKGLDPDSFVDALESAPMFAERKLVIVTDLDVYKAPAALKNTLEAALEDIPEYTCLVFVYDSLEYKTDARAKIHRIIKEYARVIEFPIQESRDLISWLKRRFKVHNKLIDNSTAEYMLFICGKSMTALINEVEKVGAYSSGGSVTRQDIDAICTPVLDAVVYDMTDSIAEGRFDQAFKLLDELNAMRSEPIVILAAIGRQMRQLLCAREAIDCGGIASAAKHPGSVGNNWGGGAEDLFMTAASLSSRYIAGKVMSLARRKPAEWYAEACRLCIECDYDIKTSAGGGVDLLKTMLLRLSESNGK